MKITERVAYAYHYKLEPLGILGLFICGIGIFGLTIVLLIDEWYFPDAHKPQID
ncbi:hypothetical protein NF867_03695 [Solitalea sp. MAHUQ-68]|uniref:Uncharacterized protein n=1 Tax=Solitalea agri TaxID=2953739 RepID=A0A9X2F4Y8_9SPHI|nr:hypothetical protein [Solitalea agri]MCO4291963.1 hypothetical protein [Solitalea agri]